MVTLSKCNVHDTLITFMICSYEVQEVSRKSYVLGTQGIIKKICKRGGFHTVERVKLYNCYVWICCFLVVKVASSKKLSYWQVCYLHSSILDS